MDNDYSQLEFVEVPRNAPGITVNGRSPNGNVIPAGGNFGARTFVAQPRFSQYPQYPQYPQQSPYFYAHPGFGVGVGAGALGAGMFGRMTTGQVIDMVAQIFAALMPLPAAPTVTNDSNTDSGNTILYQSALAQYAKRDEQVRTLGNLIVKLVG